MGDEGVLKNTTFPTKHTFIGFSTEDRSEYDSLVQHIDQDHIVFTDRSINQEDMQPLYNTLQLGLQIRIQVNGNLRHPIFRAHVRAADLIFLIWIEYWYIVRD